MKSKLNLSFKRISIRPVTNESDRVTMIKKVLCIEYGNVLETDTLIVNIDEAAQFQTTRMNYSWWRRGKWIIMKTPLSMAPYQFITSIISKGD